MIVEFRYSKILDELLHQLASTDCKRLEERKSFCIDKIKEFDDEWADKGHIIIDRISSLTGIQFPTTAIVYILRSWPNDNTKFTAISNPLILTVDRPFDESMNLLIHELIHLNIKGSDASRSISLLFPNDSVMTRNHVIVHAILEQVLISVYDKGRVDLDKLMCEEWVDFRRAWEIVKEKGSSDIISQAFIK
jgi:hypothetical protein